jgi:hypothetical protein
MKTNEEILNAIQKDLETKGCTTKEAIKIIRFMSDEDIGAYYHDKCKV